MAAPPRPQPPRRRCPHRRSQRGRGRAAISLAELFAIVLPVFCFIAVGYGVMLIRLLPKDAVGAVSAFTFAVAVPILLFRSLGTLELPDAVLWPYWATYFSGVALTVALGILITEFVFKRDARAGVIGGMSASFSNTVMVGIPVLNQALGEDGLMVGFVLVAVHLPVMMLASAVLIEVAELRDGTRAGGINLGALATRVGRNLATNPLIVAIVAGVLFRLTGLPLTGVPGEVIDRIADTAIPLALISLGMALRGYGISGNIRPAIWLSVLKLGVMPALIYALAVYVFGLPSLALAGALVFAACPTGVNAYLIAGRFQTGLALSANTITLTTAVSVVTFTLWLWVLGI